MGVGKLRKCAKLVASLFTRRKSKKVSAEEVATEEIRNEVFEFVTDPNASQLVFPVFGREASAVEEPTATTLLLSGFDDDRDRQSSEEAEGDDVIDFCSWEPELCILNDGDHHQQSSAEELETSAAAAPTPEEPEELEHCVWKPRLSDLSCEEPVEISLFVWELESKLNIGDELKPAADEDQKPSAAKTEAVCSLKQEGESKVSSCRWQHLLAGFLSNDKRFSRTLLTSF